MPRMNIIRDHTETVKNAGNPGPEIKIHLAIFFDATKTR